MLAEPFAKTNEVAAKVGTMLHDVPTGKGFGGDVTVDIGRAASLLIGPVALPDPLVFISKNARNGVFTYKDIAGVIGGPVLCRFRLIVDYNHKRVIFKKNGAFGDPFESDASGLHFVADETNLRRYTVHFVLPKSPADEAGIRSGDLLESIDGRKSEDFSLDQIQTMFKKPGRVVHVMLRRESKPIDVELHLRRLI